MLEFQERRKIKKFIYSKFTLALLIFFIIIILNAVWNVYKKQALTDDNLSKVEINLNSVKSREDILESEIRRLKTKVGIEEEIREKFGLVKPGEEVIIIVDDENKDEINNASSGFNIWQKIKDWLR